MSKNNISILEHISEILETNPILFDPDEVRLYGTPAYARMLNEIINKLKENHNKKDISRKVFEIKNICKNDLLEINKINKILENLKNNIDLVLRTTHTIELLIGTAKERKEDPINQKVKEMKEPLDK